MTPLGHMRWAVVLLALMLASTPGKADGLIDEIRLGGLAQNIEPSGHAHEHGFDLNAEVLFAAPFATSGLFGFRPHLGGTYNFEGTTDKLYAGLTWDVPLQGRLFLEGSLGAAIHDGGLTEGDVAQYGCRVNFRESASIGYDLDPHWRVMLMVDHMSNANLCAKNRGLTNAGLRLGYTLN